MKKSIKTLLIAVLALVFVFSSVMPAFAANLSEGTYKVPIKELTTKAPMASIKKGFATAFGDYAIVKVDASGNQTVYLQTEHMVIMEKDANILTVEGAKVECTKTEKYTSTSNQLEDITCPDIISMPFTPDENGSMQMNVTVDYLNGLLGKGGDFNTSVTLTLDYSAAQAVDAGTHFTPRNGAASNEKADAPSNDKPAEDKPAASGSSSASSDSSSSASASTETPDVAVNSSSSNSSSTSTDDMKVIGQKRLASYTPVIIILVVFLVAVAIIILLSENEDEMYIVKVMAEKAVRDRENGVNVEATEEDASQDEKTE